jgi:hypothetical protein
MKTASTYRPHEALGSSHQKENIYWSQYQHQCWFQLAWCLIKQWKVELVDFPILELKLDGVKAFKVSLPMADASDLRESEGRQGNEPRDRREDQALITSSNELKGLEMTPENLVNMSENVASTMYEDINDVIKLGEGFMVHSHLSHFLP